MKKPSLSRLDAILVLVFAVFFLLDVSWVTYTIHRTDIDYYLGL